VVKRIQQKNIQSCNRDFYQGALDKEHPLETLQTGALKNSFVLGLIKIDEAFSECEATNMAGALLKH